MPNLFYLEDAPIEKTITINNNEFHHFKTLRKKKEDIVNCYFQGIVYKAKITHIEENSAKLNVMSSQKIKKNIKTHSINVFLSIPKPQTLKNIIPTLNEIGIDTLYPIITKRSFFQKKDKINTERYEKIALESSKQCMRWIPIQIEKPLFLNELTTIENSLKNSQNILCYEKETKHTIFDFPIVNKNISLFFGPEGGISEEEKILLDNIGFQSLQIDDNILKVTTALIKAVSIIETKIKIQF